MYSSLLLRFAMAIILLFHSLPGMWDNGVNDFGNLYLNQIGFAPFGVTIAWLVKLSHVGCGVLFVLNKHLKIATAITSIILVLGIIMIHFKEGWFVVGGGTNGMEFNFLLICVMLAIVLMDNREQEKKRNLLKVCKH